MNSIKQNIIAYRGLLDDSGCSLSGRVLGRPLLLDPGEHDTWWDNLVNAYRRFDSERIPGVRVETRTEHPGLCYVKFRRFFFWAVFS